MNTVSDYMNEALIEADKALMEGEVPVGAIIVNENGEIVGRGHNTRENDLDISGHAEIAALKDAAKKIGRWSMEKCSIFVTLEPCPMCSGALMQSRIKSIYFGAYDKDMGAVSSKYHLFDECLGQNAPLVYGGIEEERCAEILKTFFLSKRK